MAKSPGGAPALTVPMALSGPNTTEAWKNRVAASRKQIEALKPEWDRNLERYLAKKKEGAHKDEVIVPKDYANTEQKKGQLFFQTPYIQALPIEPAAQGLEDAVTVFEAVINHYLGPDGVAAKTMADEVLMDALCPSGIFASKIAYECVVDGTTLVPLRAPAAPMGAGMPPAVPSGPPPAPPMPPPGGSPSSRPLAGPPSAPPLAGPPAGPMGLTPPAPAPFMVEAPNIIHERYLWERISPAKLLIPEEFTGSNYDKCPWIGFDFLMDFSAAKRAFGLADDFQGFVGDDDQLIGHARVSTDGRGMPKRVKGSEIWYKAAFFDDTVKQPEHQRVLVLIDGAPAPVKHDDSPYQTVQPDGSIVGMPGFPVHVGALRYVPDTAFPPSDCAMSKAQVEEISKGRTQMIRQRERSIPLRIGPIGLGDEFYNKVERNIWQSIIPIEDSALMAYGAEGPIRVVARAEMPRENFTFDQIADRDISETWALDATQRGVLQQKDVTATEIDRSQQNANIRLTRERNIFLEWFARGVTKLASLIQQFADEQRYVAVVGPDGARRLQVWDKTTIQGRFIFQCKPDSGVFIDAASMSQQALQRFNLLHASPFINQQELLAETLRAMNLDPSKLISPPQPRPTEVPKITFTFNDQSCDPRNPAFPIVMQILQMGGMPVGDTAIAAAQRLASTMGPTASATSHGEPQAPPPARTLGNGSGGAVEPVNKHLTEATGDRPGPKVAVN